MSLSFHDFFFPRPNLDKLVKGQWDDKLADFMLFNSVDVIILFRESFVHERHFADRLYSKAVFACAYRVRGKHTFHFCKVKQFPAKFFGLSGLKLDKNYDS